jgi:F1F0 ATPase subunit 2
VVFEDAGSIVRAVQDLLVPAAAGAGLGGVYFFLLWRSTRTFSRGRRSVAWLLGGTLVRIAALVAAFFLVMDGQWERLLACLAGFVAARFVMIRRYGSRPDPEALEPQP